MKSITVKSHLSELERIRGFLKKALGKKSLSEEAYFIIELAILEMCVNIIRYAYPDVPGELTVSVWFENDRVFFELRDSGIPFNPQEAREPEIQEMISRGKKGGLGIFLARKLMDGFTYRREDDQNVLTMYKKISVESASSV